MRPVPLRELCVVLALLVTALAHASLAQAPPACPVADRPPIEASPHLAYESDALDDFLSYGGFVVRLDERRSLPLFTIHRLTPDAITLRGGPAARRRSTFRVVDLDNGNLSATDRDYEQSGYDRGHLVPAGDFVWNQGAKDETFTYTNVAPFNPNLNRGAWAQLESALRERVRTLQEDAYVVTGALFLDGKTRIGPNELEVPSHYFKLAYFPEHGSMFAFLFDNTIADYFGRLSDFQTTVDFIERMTGEDFYDALHDDCEGVLESMRAPFDGPQ